MANKIDTRILKIHCKSYEGDVHGFDTHINVAVWDTEANNDFEANFLLEQFQEKNPNMLVTVEEYRPRELEVTGDNSVFTQIYPIPEPLPENFWQSE